MYTHIPLLFRSTLAVALGVATPQVLLADEPAPQVILIRTAPQIAPVATVVEVEDKPAAEKPAGEKPANKSGEVRQEQAAAQAAETVLTVVSSPEDEERAMPAYWLGIHLEPLPELVKSQLALEHGIVVHATLPDSPAAKAGLKTHDILLMAGEQVLKEPIDLIDLLEVNKDKAIQLTYLRTGKKATLEITPSKRPESLPELAAQVEKAVAEGVAEGVGDLDAPIRKLEEAIRSLHGRHGGAPGLWVVRPPVAAPPGVEAPHAAPPMPADLSISINKSGDNPAKITVKQGDKKWEVTEDKLGELPESVRPHVERMVGSTQVEVVANPLADGQLRLQVRRIERPEMPAPGAAPQVQRFLVVPPGVPAVPGIPPVPAPPGVPAHPGARVIKVVPAPNVPAVPAPGGHGPDAIQKHVQVHVVQKDGTGDDVIVKKLDEVLKRLESLEKKLK